MNPIRELHVYRCATSLDSSLRSVAVLVPIMLCAGCLNTQSVAFQEVPAATNSPAIACRDAAEADGWTVLDVHGLEEVTDGYWEARVEVQDPEMQELVRCRHNTAEAWTEIVRLDE